MNNNIYCKIEEKVCDNNIVENDNIENKNERENYIFNEEDIINEYGYSETNIKNINTICDYYKIKKGKLSKKQKIMQIIIFENNFNNIDIVENRKMLWEYVKIIKSDKFLQQYILLDI
jgi:hypothetical protein